MSKRISLHVMLFLVLVLSVHVPSNAGIVFFSGDDADDFGHCPGTACGGLYAAIFSFSIANSASPGTGILAIGVNAGQATTALNSWNDPINGGPGAAVTILTDPAMISTAVLTDFAMVYIPSNVANTQGGIQAPQLDALNTRQADIVDFVNVFGGALVALTEAGSVNAYGWLPIPVQTADQIHTTVAPTPALTNALAPAATSANMSHGFYHTIFTGPPGFLGLDVLATSTDAPVGDVVLLGGADVLIGGQIVLSPTSAMLPTAFSHTLTATVRDILPPNDPVVNTLVTFNVLSGPNAGTMGTATTDLAGIATFAYTGLDVAGTDQVQASFVDPNGLRLSNIVSAQWVAGQVTLTPAASSGNVRGQHTVNADVRQGAPPSNPFVGATVTFQILSGPNAGVMGTGVTDAAGMTSFMYTSVDSVGIDQIQASFFDAGAPQVSNTATQSWLAGQVTLTQGMSTGLFCTDHTVTANTHQALAPFTPLAGTVVTFDVISGPNAGAFGTGVTDAAGNATFTYTGMQMFGTDQIQASFVDAGATQLSNILTVTWSPSANDCNLNGVPDECEQGGLTDCNLNGMPDLCDLVPVLQYDAGTPYPVGAIPNRVIATELDGVLGPDLVSANSGQRDVSVLLNAGNGIFASAINYPTDKEAFAVVAKDFDGDGDLDLAAATKNDTVSVLLNDGNGAFISGGDFPTLGNRPTSMAAGDFDGLNGPDVAVANRNVDPNGNFTVSILFNNGDGTLSAPVSVIVQDTPSDVDVADFDGVNGPDLAVANKQSDTISVLLNNGNGTFALAVNVFVGNGPVSIAVADLDGDLDPDMAVTDTGSDLVGILLNNGSGGFTSGGNLPVGFGPTSVDAADLDGDGDVDLAVANNGSLALPGSTFSILLNQGTGTFVAQTVFTTGSSPFWLTAADLNQSGTPDLAVAQNLAAGVVTVHLGVVMPFSEDCNANAIPDECEIDMNSPAPGGPFFCAANCDPDCNGNGIPDTCDPESRDVGAFVATLTADVPDPMMVCMLDRNGDGLVNGDDIQLFVDNFLLGP